MKTSEAVRQRLKELIKQHSLTINGLAYSSAMPATTLKNILSGVSKNPGVVTIRILCDGMDITLAEFFDCDLFNDLEQEIE